MHTYLNGISPIVDQEYQGVGLVPHHRRKILHTSNGISSTAQSCTQADVCIPVVDGGLGWYHGISMQHLA